MKFTDKVKKKGAGKVKKKGAVTDVAIRTWMGLHGKDYKEAAAHFDVPTGELRVLLGLPASGPVGRWSHLRLPVLAMVDDGSTCDQAARALRPPSADTQAEYRKWADRCKKWSKWAKEKKAREVATAKPLPVQVLPTGSPKKEPSAVDQHVQTAKWDPALLTSEEYWRELITRLQSAIEWADSKEHMSVYEKLVARQMSARRELDGLADGQKVGDDFSEMSPNDLIEMLTGLVSDEGFPMSVVDQLQAACEDRRKPMFEGS